VVSPATYQDQVARDFQRVRVGRPAPTGTPLAISGIKAKHRPKKRKSGARKRSSKRASGKITCKMQVTRGGHRRRVCRDSLGRIVAQKKRSRRSSRRRKRS
jgi:hypothetical protein